jgi:hypothetical protein
MPEEVLLDEQLLSAIEILEEKVRVKENEIKELNVRIDRLYDGNTDELVDCNVENFNCKYLEE